MLGALNHGLFFALLYVAAYRLPSGLGSTLTALSPLVLMGLAFLVLGERQARVTVGAAVVGVAGVVTLVWQNESAGTVDPVGVAAAVGAVLSSSLGFVLVKRWAPREDVLVTTTWQLVAGGLLLVPLAAVVEGAPPALDGSAVLALAYLGLVGSAVGYVLWFRGLTRMDAGAVAVVGLVNPVVGTALGVAPPRRALRPGPPRRRGGHPRKRPRRPGTGAAPPSRRSRVPPSGRLPSRSPPAGPDGRRPAYGGSMAPVSTATLTTPTGPVEIPTIGFGVWQVPEDEVGPAVATALEAGYRHIDTARIYGNEAGVGRALAASDVPRDEVFVTTKVWNDDHGRDATLAAFDASMGRLRLDVLDLYLVHWPVPRQDRYVETWRTLLELRDEGRVRAVGVCNFHAEHLQRLFDETGEWPSINQIELHPYLQQAPLRAFDERARASSPSRGARSRRARRCSTTPSSGGSPANHGATPAQVVIAWHLALDLVVLPKSVTPSRIVENLAAAELTLTGEELAALAGAGPRLPDRSEPGGVQRGVSLPASGVRHVTAA